MSLFGAVMLLTNGCAVNGVGTVAARVTAGTGAHVIDIYSLGGHLRTWRVEPGLTVGFTKRSYIYECESNTPECLLPGWHYFKVPAPPSAVARDVWTAGVELTIAPTLASFTVGYSAMTVMVRLPVGQPTFMRLRYISGKPEETILEICKENQACDH